MKVNAEIYSESLHSATTYMFKQPQSAILVTFCSPALKLTASPASRTFLVFFQFAVLMY